MYEHEGVRPTFLYKHVRCHVRILMCALLAIGAAIAMDGGLQAQEAAPPQPAPAAIEDEGPVHGYFSTRYRIRDTHRKTDQDLYETASLYVGDKHKDALTFRFLTLAEVDIEGETDTRGPYVFRELSDTRDKGLQAQLLEGYAEAHRIPKMDVLRGGRQILDETPVNVTIDGVRAETVDLTEADIRLGAFGGMAVHFFDSSGNDLAGGAYAQGRPWEGGKLRVDWMRLDDDTALLDYTNDLLGFAAWQTVCERVEVHGRHTRVDENGRDVLFRGVYRDTDSAFTAQASYYELLKTRRDYALELDPFYGSAFEYLPYSEIRGFLSKGIGSRITLDAGMDVRWLESGRVEADFNREFQRYYVSPTVRRFIDENLSLTFTGELWKSDDFIRSWGLDLTHQCTKDLRSSVGTSYSLYKYDTFSGGMRDDVRTVYARLRYKVQEHIGFDLAGEVDDAEEETVRTLRLGMTWDF